MRRRRADDAAPFARLHAGNDGADRVEGCGEPDRDDGVPFVDREFLDRRDVLNARIVDQDVDRPGNLRGLADHGGDLGGLGHVGGIVECLDAELGFEAGPDLLDLVLVAEAVDHHVRLLGGERARHGEPDPGGRAGDDGGLSSQHGPAP